MSDIGPPDPIDPIDPNGPFDPADPIGPLERPTLIDPEVLRRRLRLNERFEPVVDLGGGNDVTLGQLVDETVVAKGWALANRLGRDPRTVLTWDPKLVRDRRIFVPVDVQAFVVADADGEATVPVSGGPDDPPPFADAEVRAPGVHLHWALPDALLRGAIPDEADDGDDFDFPDLPDRWVVIRIQYPNGWRQVRTTGWVIDSIQGSVTPLADYAGTPTTTDALDTFDRLDAKVGGSLHWTATYEASVNRFAFHDPLDDDRIADGADPGRATYVVAGWATATDRDPLGPTRSDRADLTTLLDQLRWSATDIPAGEYQHRDEDLRRADDTILTRQDTIGERLEVIAQGRQERFDQVQLTASGSGIELPADRIVLAADPPPYASLFHGFVAAVPTDGTPDRAADDRPRPEAVDVALGLDLNDVVAAWATEAWGVEGASRRSLELLASAFTTDLLDRLTSSDGLNDIEEADHAGSFWSFVGPPLPNSTDDRLVNTDAAAANPLVMGRKGRAGQATAAKQPTSRKKRTTTATIRWSDEAGDDVIGERRRQEEERRDQLRRRSGAIGRPEWRDVPKPGPRLHRPQAPILAVRGCRPALRYLGDGMFEDDGSLKVRYPSQLIETIDGVIGGADVVPTLGSGALPPEVLAAVREAALIDPYNGRWLAAAATTGQPRDRRFLVEQRLEAESLLLYSTDGRYHGDVSGALADIENGSPPAKPTWGRPVADLRDRRRLSVELSRWSLTGGVGPSPVGVTTWRQPWAPLWIEWQVEVAGSDSLDGWRLDDVDLVAARAPEEATITRTIVGRSPLGRGAVKAVHQAIDQWRTAQTRRRTSVGYQTRRDLVDLGQFLDPLDMASGSLDGIREQLLDIDYVGGLASGPDEDDDRPPAGPDPHPLFSGRIALKRLRLVDAFGRTLEVPVDRVATTTVLEDPDRPEAITVPPRLQHGSRLLLRLIDPASRGDEAAAEAFVDQDNPERAVNPVVGFLLPDHIDEGLEFFDSAGTPLGQLGHHELTGAVRWEPAPGRPLPPSAGPLADLDDHARIAGQLASAIVQADINSRSPGAGTEVDGPPPDVGESPLNAVLRAIDTTMWTVDTLDGTGTSGLAGLVGRPIAIVRALIRLDAPADLDEVRLPSPDAARDRQAAFDGLTDHRFPVRLGDLARSDDALLGYFVDDDYGRFHLVDPRVATQARDGGRHRGQLGILGDVTTPATAPLTHPLVAPDGVLWLQPGRTHRLTLLMLPAGKVHVTSGILPRKSIALHNDWVEAGLRRLVPSVRVGPVLVDPDQIRLPKVNLLGERQQFTRRTGPLTWRDDPIVAASQSALLPRIPHEVQEGWVRVVEDGEDGSEGAADV